MSQPMGIFHIPIAAFTILALVAGFCLMIAEPPRAAGDAEWAANVVPSVAGEPALLLKTEDSRFSAPRTEFQRVFTPGGAHGAVFVFHQPSFRLHATTGRIDIENTILLKLRI
jgi:hypothetical protein